MEKTRWIFFAWIYWRTLQRLWDLLYSNRNTRAPTKSDKHFQTNTYIYIASEIFQWLELVKKNWNNIEKKNEFYTKKTYPDYEFIE